MKHGEAMRQMSAHRIFYFDWSTPFVVPSGTILYDEESESANWSQMLCVSVTPVPALKTCLFAE